MVFNNIFKQTTKNNINHPMSNPRYTDNVNTHQGVTYLKYKQRRQTQIMNTDTKLIEGFTESMTASDKNNSDLIKLTKLQQEMETVLETLQSTSKDLVTEATNNVGDFSDTNKYAIDSGEYNKLTYKDCYKDDSSSADNRKIPYYQGVKTHEQCAQRAHDLGMDIFGMQYGSGPTAQCWIGHDHSKAKSGGISSKKEIYYQTDDEGIIQLALGYDGNLRGFTNQADSFDDGINNTWDDSVWDSDSSQSGCPFGQIGISDVYASYGTNCTSTTSTSDSAYDYTHYTPGCVSGNNISSISDKTVDECKTICDGMDDCLAFEYGVDHGGSATLHKNQCRPQSSHYDADENCDGSHYNLDVYDKGDLATVTSSLSVKPGQATQYFDSLIGETSGDVLVDSSTWGDPAYGCAKTFEATYTCGFGSTTKTISLDKEANGKTASLDCSDVCTKSPFTLTMQDDGNLVIYDKDKVSVWSTNTSGKAGTANKWGSNSGCIGSSIESGTIWNYGKYLCSPSGKNIAYMANGKLKVARALSNCTQSDGKYFGGSDTNAIYTIDKNDLSNMGKVGNLTDNTVKKFPSSLLTEGTTFTKIKGYNLEGSDAITVISNKSLKDIKKICAENSNYTLFTVQYHGSGSGSTLQAHMYGNDCSDSSIGNSNHCFGKKFPSLQNRIADSGTDIYVKNPGINSNNTCGSDSTGVTLSTYNNYKSGGTMKNCSPCGLAEAIHDDLCAENSAYKIAEAKAKEIINEMEILTNTSEEFKKLQPQLRNKLYSQIEDYTAMYNKILTTETAIVTTNAQSDDSDLNVIAENFQFVMWSIIAIIAVIVTMKLVKKH